MIRNILIWLFEDRLSIADWIVLASLVCFTPNTNVGIAVCFLGVLVWLTLGGFVISKLK